MRLFLLPLLLLSLVSSPLRAQAPGLMGKTWLIAAGIDPYAYLLDPSTSADTGNASPAGNSQSLPVGSIRLRFEVSTMLSRGIEVGLQYTQSGLAAEGMPPLNTGIRESFLPLRGRRRAVQLTGRWYPLFANGIAPSGFYLRLGGGLEIDRFTYLEAVTDRPGLGEDFSLSVTPNLSLGLGYRYALFDRLLLEIGFSTGFGRRGSHIIGNSLAAATTRDVVNALYFMDNYRLLLAMAVPF